MRKWQNKLEWGLLLALPAVMFFSYYPVIALGANESMNFELSLPLIWLALFGAMSFLKLPGIIRHYGAKKSALILLFPLWAALSVLWSQNPLRGVLTAGILWLIVISILNIINLKLTKMQLGKLLRVFMIASVIAAAICILQCFLDVFGVGRDITLLCQGCTYLTFGFPHPNGLAIEPQFMGNLLIAPALTSLVLSYNAIKSHKNKQKVFGFAVLSFFLIMTLYVCFSRGALYAFSIGGLVLGAAMLVREKNLRVLYMAVVTVAGFCGGLLMQGVLAEISPTNEGFTQGIQRSLHQVSLGVIDIREKTKPTETENEAKFDGYIEESTETRLNLTEAAIKTWQDHALLGVGVGGAGVAMKEYSGGTEKEIIQNEYINILTELGVVGVILLIALAVVVIRNWKGDLLLFSIIIAFLVTLGFFSGFPNVLHIYLLPPILYWVGQKRRLC